MTDSAGWARRQFVARGGATALAVAGLARTRVAAAEVLGQLSSQQLAVVAALGSAVLKAAGQPSSNATSLGVQPPATIAQTFAQLDPTSQAEIAAMLDTVQSAAPAGGFTKLSAAKQQAFLKSALSPLASKAAPDPAFQRSVAANFGAYTRALVANQLPTLPAEDVDPSLSEPSDLSADLLAAPVLEAPLTHAQSVANDVLGALALVTTQIPPPPPAPPPPSPAPVLTGLIDELLAGVPVDTSTITGLLDPLGEDPSDDARRPLVEPAPVFGEALAHLVAGAGAA